MRADSLDLRVRVLADFDAGLNYAEVARQYTVSAEWVRLLVQRRTQTGAIAARTPVSGRVPFHAGLLQSSRCGTHEEFEGLIGMALEAARMLTAFPRDNK